MDDRDELGVVTVLFADVAGSTALAEGIDPEELRVLQGELFALVNAEVERFGGLSEKFVGDAVLAVFGVPLAHCARDRGPRAAPVRARVLRDQAGAISAASRSRQKRPSCGARTAGRATSSR